MADIKDILVISTPRDLKSIQRLLGDGSQWGIQLSYAIQEQPRGIADALILSEDFVGDQQVCLALGDNIIYGQGLFHWLPEIAKKNQGATIFAYHVHDPNRYGVVEFDHQGNVIELVEKPKQPRSNYAVAGLYIYDQNAVTYAKNLKPSHRGELEITDVNREYLHQGNLTVERFGRGTAWLDTGTPDALLEAANFIQVLQKRTQLKIGCPEELVWRKGWIDDKQLLSLAKQCINKDYCAYLENIYNENY